jgi:hypothetical protein
MSFWGSQGRPMDRTEAEYCRHQAERLLRLAEECVDPAIRDQVRAMANEWLARAAAKEPHQERRDVR